MKPIVLIVAGVLASAATLASGAEINDARLRAGGDNRSDWLTYGRDYGHQRFSPLDQVNAGTVKKLVPKWIYQTGMAATFQTSPLVADGIMYLTTPFSHVVALDARTGRELMATASRMVVLPTSPPPRMTLTPRAGCQSKFFIPRKRSMDSR